MTGRDPGPRFSGSPWSAIALFLAGLALFVGFQVGLVWEVQSRRALPPELDDAYVYIFKAVQLRDSFWQDAPALEDLRRQTAPDPRDSEARQWLKYRTYSRLFVVYHPLYSGLLLLVSRLADIPLESAYKWLSVLGSLGLAGSFAYFLLVLAGPAGAGIALGSLALVVFPGQGIHYVVPSNLSLGVGMVLLGRLLATRGRAWLSLFLLSLLALGLHRVGLVYVGLGVLTMAALRWRERRRRGLILEMSPTLVLVGLYLALPFLISHPTLALPSQVPPAGASYALEVWHNLREIVNKLGKWLLHHGLLEFPGPFRAWVKAHWLLALASQALGGLLVLLAWGLGRKKKERRVLTWTLAALGLLILAPVWLTLLTALMLTAILAGAFLGTAREPRSRLITLILVILTGLILSAFYVQFRYHAELTQRVWILAAVILAGIFAQGLLYTFRQINLWSRGGSPEGLPVNLTTLTKSSRLLSLMVLSAFLFFLLAGYGPHLVAAYRYREKVQRDMIARQDVTLDLNQPRVALEHSCPGDVILYDDEIILLFVLSHGGLERQAIFTPLLPLPRGFPLRPEAVTLRIAWNPYLSLQDQVGFPLALAPGWTLAVSLDPAREVSDLQIRRGLGHSEGASLVEIIRDPGAGSPERQAVPLPEKEWQTVPLGRSRGGSLSLRNPLGDRPLFLAGLRLSKNNDAAFTWTWEGVRKVSLVDREGIVKRSFSLSPREDFLGQTYHSRVLQDQGATVVVQLDLN